MPLGRFVLSKKSSQYEPLEHRRCEWRSMFLTMLDHGGHTWMVELRAMPDTDGLGSLELSFTRSGVAGDELRLTWRVASQALQSLSEKGVDVSEELLRRQTRPGACGSENG